MPTIEVGDIRDAQVRIAPYVRRTPLLRSTCLSALTHGEIYLKLENLQETGAFKVRGAANALLQMSPEQRRRGVIAFSTGNHGRAVAWVGQQLDIRVVVCVPSSVLPHKVTAMRALGAEVRVVGDDQDAAEAEARRLGERDGLTWVSPFDDPWVIAGQGTIGLEILDELPSVEVVLAPLSGGGLLGGIALAVKSAKQKIHIVGVTMERGAGMVESLAAGRPIPVIEEPTLADSLVGSIGLDNCFTFELVKQLVDETVLVSEAEIANALVYALQQEKIVVEGGGAVALAALLAGKLNLQGKTVACVVSGGNVDMAMLGQLIMDAQRAGSAATSRRTGTLR